MFGSTSVLGVFMIASSSFASFVTPLRCALCPLRIFLDLTRLSDIMTTLPSCFLCTNPVFTEGKSPL